MAVAHRIYARSLLEAAKEHGRLELAREDLGEFVAAVMESPELRELLRSPQLDPGAKRAGLEAILAEADALIRNFLLLLNEKNRIGELDEIHEEFERLCAAEERVLQLELTTAVELSDEEAARIARRIEEQTGRRVEIARNTDPSLIGGLVLQADSLRIDGSVRGRLNALRRELATRT